MGAPFATKAIRQIVVNARRRISVDRGGLQRTRCPCIHPRLERRDGFGARCGGYRTLLARRPAPRDELVVPNMRHHGSKIFAPGIAAILDRSTQFTWTQANEDHFGFWRRQVPIGRAWRHVIAVAHWQILVAMAHSAFHRRGTMPVGTAHHTLGMNKSAVGLQWRIARDMAIL